MPPSSVAIGVQAELKLRRKLNAPSAAAPSQLSQNSPAPSGIALIPGPHIVRYAAGTSQPPTW
eukprot:14505126-Heterocapsa_arctica.AAC.1